MKCRTGQKEITKQRIKKNKIIEIPISATITNLRLFKHIFFNARKRRALGEGNKVSDRVQSYRSDVENICDSHLSGL